MPSLSHNYKHLMKHTEGNTGAHVKISQLVASLQTS